MYSSFTSSYMQPSERVRRQWRAFEQWVETVPRAAMTQEISETFRAMDTKWNATPARTRPTKQDNDKLKATFRRELEDNLFALAREEWQRRLAEVGLKDEDWGPMTAEETFAVVHLLGGDLDDEGLGTSVAQADVDSHTRGLPALTHETRASNLSDYSFVSPTSLGTVDDDWETFEPIFANEILPSSGPESVVDEIFDTPTSVPWGWNGDSSSYGVWSAATSQSSRQSSQTGSPERPPPKTIAADHTFFPRVTEPLSAHLESLATSASSSHSHSRTRAPRYIGPQMTDNDGVFDDEADFERFKMDTRITKIREFHEEAARADIQLAQDIYNARTTSTTWRDEEERKIIEHEKRMIELRRSKEEERKAIVRAERHARRDAILLRQQLRNTPMGWNAAAAESPRDRLAQEVESKLRMATASASAAEPVVTSAETRRDRRLSQSTISSRNARASILPELDRLVASVPDLLSVPTSSSSTASSTPVSSASSSTSSSQLPSRWLPPPEIVKAAVSTTKSKKKPGPPAVDLGASVNVTPSAGTMKQQGRKPTADDTPTKPTKPTSFAVEPQLPFVVSPSAASTLFSSLPPTVTKVGVSSASATSSKAKGPSPATSKAPSPPVVSKSQPPPAPPKRQSPPSNSQPPPTSAKAPSPAAHTPKPTAPVVSAPPQKKTTRVVEIQTPGASSSRTTLEQVQRPFIHKSLGSNASFGAPPPPAAAPGREIWVSSSSAAAKKVDTGKAVSSSSSSHEKSTSVSVPPLAETIRSRRMSDPVSPSPRIFALPDDVQELKPAADVPSRMTKKGKGKQAKAKRVTIEEVSDEEDADTLERLPVDSKYIFEPKPSVPPTMFSEILDFAPTPPPVPPSTTLQSDSSSRVGHPPAPSRESDGRSLTGDGKHVRWTPSAPGNAAPTSRSSLAENNELRTALEALETNVLSPPPSGTKKGARNRASSLLQSATTGNRKGKGKERAVEPAADDEFARYLKGATLDFTTRG
ncbi:hypothetical protein B0H14DRAFT_2948834 [Mycena olivaceomarginata]|nr:hypothetical protein B0H14DRAFT_2948834 [Mycena olivaceomarginata]